MGSRLGKTAPTMDAITPLWESIRSIKIGEHDLKPEKWNNGDLWNLKINGPGGRGSWKGKIINYYLWLDTIE